MTDEKEPAIIAGSSHTMRTRVDGSLSMTVEIEPKHAALAFSMFGLPGTPIALARLTNEAANTAAQRQTIQQAADDGEHGHHYSALYRVGWFFNPRVVGAFGVDPKLPPNDRTDAIKAIIYRETGVDSLTKLAPRIFVALCDRRGIINTVPSLILDAVAGGADA